MFFQAAVFFTLLSSGNFVQVAAEGSCPALTDPCMNDSNYKECMDIQESGCSMIVASLDCPVSKFACAHDVEGEDAAVNVDEDENDDDDDPCPDRTMPCMNDSNYQQCIDIRDRGCRVIIATYDCPVSTFACADDDFEEEDVDSARNDDDDNESMLNTFCFSGNMEVVVRGRQVIPMEALQVGDFVKIGNGEAYEQVYAFGHRDRKRSTEFVQLHTNAGAPLEMTGEHLVFLDGKTNPVRADSIRVGDVLQSEGNNAIVEKIELITRKGIYNPLTSSGTIQVNGITASNYISFQKDNNENIELQGGLEIPMSHHDFAHRAMAPFRFYCTALAVCDVNDDEKFGLPTYVSKGIELIEWGHQQHVAVQLAIWVSYWMLMFASMLMVYMALMISGYLLLLSIMVASWLPSRHRRSRIVNHGLDIASQKKRC